MIRRFIVFLMTMAFIMPCIAKAADIEEYEVGAAPPKQVAIKKEPAPKPAPSESKEVAKAEPKETTKAESKEKIKNESKESKESVETKTPVSDSFYKGREGDFRAGFVGPGIGIMNKNIGALMSIGVDGEYFFWEHLSVVVKFEALTTFKNHTIVGLVPYLRYVFDSDKYPRWNAYVQGGAGLALYQGTHPAADISIPGIGIGWQWTKRWSLGAETNFHILLRSDTAFEWTLGPTIRYQF